MERNITINWGDELYVIEHDGGYSTLGFDVCLDRIQSYSNNLAREAPTVVRGSLAAYDTMKNLETELRKQFEETGERAIALLSPQLAGIEGWRVEVIDEEGDKPRRFIVGKSTGPIPIHLELANRTSSGGQPARAEYHRVRQLERVR